MKKTNLLTLLVASSFIALNAYAMEEQEENNRDFAGHVRGILPVEENEENQYQFTIIEDIVFPATGNPRATFLVRSSQGQEVVEKDIELLEMAHMRYESQLYAGLDLNPNHPLPEVLGTARERVRCTFNYAGRGRIRQLLLPTEYPLRGEWEPVREDRDHHQNVHPLQLRALRGDQPIDVFQHRPIQAYTPHELVDVQGERIGNNYFDGYNVRREGRILQQWRNLRNTEPYQIDLVTRVCNLQNHEDNEIVYVEPFAFEGNRLLPREEYRGNYSFRRDLTAEERLKRREPNRLIYSDGADIYLPHITQELWRREDAHVCFFIASYRRERRLNFIRQATLPEDRFPEGLYELHSVQDRGSGRIERWRRLGDDPQEIEVGSPTGVSSIPGMGGSAPRLVPMTHAGSDVFNLMNTIQRLTEIVRQNANHQGANESVFILGPAKSGKSTLVHHLEGLLEALRDEGEGFILHPTRTLPGFNIGHDVNVGTQLPCFYFDRAHRRVIGDTPGFGDPRGTEKDITNAFLRHEILKGNFKLILAIPESKLADGRIDFIELLNEMTEVFPEENTLKENLSLIITKKTRGNIHTRLERILQGNPPLLTHAARELLEHLLKPINRIRVAAFPFPTREGPYAEGIAEIAQSIEAAHPVRDPRVNIRVGAGSQLLLGALGQGLNDYLTNYMKTEGAQRIVNYCRKLLDGYQQDVGSLRTTFRNLIGTLEGLQLIAAHTPEVFVNCLRNFINVDDISRTIDQLGFLKTIVPTIAYQTTAWAGALEGTIAKIQTLMAPPQPSYDTMTRVLSVKGALVSTSDINAALGSYPHSVRIDAYGLNAFFIDENITRPGGCLSFIAPSLKVIGTRNINLSGVSGGPGVHGGVGAHGTPGLPGQNGGHFYAKMFMFNGLPQLTVNTNGGAGGGGGNGGNGANGVNGADGNLAIITEQPCSSNAGVHYREVWTHIKYFYRHQGTYATPGQNGGQGGHGGHGGHLGTARIDGYQWAHVAQNGPVGNAGNPGAGGTGGLHGKHCTSGEGAKNTKAYCYDRGSGKLKKVLDRPACNKAPNPGPHHQPSRGSAPNGNAGQGLNAGGQQIPPNNPALNTGPLVQAYKAYYESQAEDPFIKVFPNL